MGLALGATYMAGGAARMAADHTRALRLAAAADGFSETALHQETAAMSPGALAVARRHDPFTVAGAAQRDRETALFADRLEPQGQQFSMASGLIRVNASAAAARPFTMAAGNPLDGARELDCLTDAVYYEARGESRSGQAAVAQVVLNRVRHPAFPKSVCGVVYQGAHSHTCQFSFACDGSVRRSKEPVAWRRAQDVAARALAGFVMAEVGNATHFHVAGMGDIWGAGLQRVAQIGTHVFYRFSGRAGGPGVFRAAPDVYSPPPSEMTDAPVYQTASAQGPTADGAGAPTMILASAVTVTGLGEGGPVGKPIEPASAPTAAAPAKAKDPAAKPAPAVSAAASATSPKTAS